MFKSYPFLLSLFLLTSIMISGCASKTNLPSKDIPQIVTSKQRTAQLLDNKKWQLRGKIAFIEKVTNKKDKRESASITWRANESKQTQKLNLTNYLGLNVLQLESDKNQHIIKVDGKEYYGTNLPQLIYSLTGLTLPTKALLFWLKGIPYKEDDKLTNDTGTQLPLSISSYYNNALWQINYSNYQTFEDIEMATKFTIKKDGLLIKLAINQWSFGD